MRVLKARWAFERYLRGRGSEVATLEPAAGVSAMLDFYREERARGCDVARDEDMLLFQWGTYDWGEGELFEFDLTRQLITGPGDEDIWQLSLTLQYPPDDALRALGSGNRWCHSPQELDEFATFVRNSPAYAAVMGRRPARASLDYSAVG
jgi:hypothetical protein